MRTAPLCDVEKVREMHRSMGMPYPFPNLNLPIYLVTQEARDDDGLLAGACAVKIVGEAFVWIEPKASEFVQARAIRALSNSASDEARRKGLEEVSAWIPPQVEERFGPFMQKLGWIKSPWHSWTRIL